nr:hypothetical protein [Tanacetum cinerariifolium]
KVPVWVKIHKVPVVAYSEDGLSFIGTQLGKRIMLDAFTSSMCAEPWGRIGFARALIEIDAGKVLKEEINMAVPKLDEEGHTIKKINGNFGNKVTELDSKSNVEDFGNEFNVVKSKGASNPSIEVSNV